MRIMNSYNIKAIAILEPSIYFMSQYYADLLHHLE
jgi:hypothetical protein